MPAKRTKTARRPPRAADVKPATNDAPLADGALQQYARSIFPIVGVRRAVVLAAHPSV